MGALIGVPLTIPAEMKRIESEPLWQILHTDRKEVNVEAVRLRNQILKYVCSEQPMALKCPVSQCENSQLHVRYPVPLLSHRQWLHTYGLKVTGSCCGKQEQLTSELILKIICLQKST